MSELVNKFYSGSKVSQYVSARQSSKWNAEQLFVENFISQTPDVEIIIDAPLGTNRFMDVIEQTVHVKKCFGLELSDDMITESKTKVVGNKMTIKKHDMMKPFKVKSDLSLSVRMLNLVDERTALKMFNNLLKSSNKYVIISLRTASKPALIDNKIYVHKMEKFIKSYTEHNFTLVKKELVPTGKTGDYEMILLSKSSGE